MKKTIWLSFDLGIRGDYEGLYTFLDTFDARECGDSTAILAFDYQTNLLDELKTVLESYVAFNNKARIYVIFREETGKYKGKFLFGRRKRSPWTGYADQPGGIDVDEAEF